MGFTAAAGSGIAIALMLRGVFKTITPSSILNKTGNLIMFNSTTSFLALAGAAYVNSVVMRYNELKNGINLYDEQGQPIGMSKIAAHRAVTHTAITRILLAFQMVFVPGVIIGMMARRNMLPGGLLMRSVSELAIIAAVLSIGMPASIAAYHR